MAKKVIRYKCAFCKKVFASKSYCEKHHEPLCFTNPLRKSCATCGHFADFDGLEFKCGAGKDLSVKLKVECGSHYLID